MNRKLHRGLLIFALVLGVLLLLLASLKFIFPFPFSDNHPFTGNASLWEILLVYSYEDWIFCGVCGAILVLLGSFRLGKVK